MRTDSVVRAEGMNALLEKLGEVDAERFVALILREPFDYTAWRGNLNKENICLRELSSRAMKNFGKQQI
ncbi:MAG: hypothetical protein LBI42_15165 [Chitinispirillales bacterium]|jgi:hypothetical protein|nr:hypothetical protein [Chitinispirillales bacterium]